MGMLLHRHEGYVDSFVNADEYRQKTSKPLAKTEAETEPTETLETESEQDETETEEDTL